MLAAHGEDLTGHVGRVVAGQEHYDVGNLPRLGVAAERLLRGQGLEQREAFGRSAEPWEVANVIVFLASDYSSYMTGEIVSVSSQHP